MKRLTALTVFIISVFAMSFLAFAGEWKQDEKGWWYDNGDGTYPSSAWQWIDGNGDGIAECYYFDGSGYLLVSTVTPDGYTVNADGAYTENGAVVTKKVGAAQTAQAAGAQSQTANEGRPDIIPQNGIYRANDGIYNYDFVISDASLEHVKIDGITLNKSNYKNTYGANNGKVAFTLGAVSETKILFTITELPSFKAKAYILYKIN